VDTVDTVDEDVVVVLVVDVVVGRSNVPPAIVKSSKSKDILGRSVKLLTAR
jgi:hypothetical protein